MDTCQKALQATCGRHRNRVNAAGYHDQSFKWVEKHSYRALETGKEGWFCIISEEAYKMIRAEALVEPKYNEVDVAPTDELRKQ